MYDWLAKYWWMLPLAALPVLAAAIALIVPLHARRRGHGFVSWFVLQFVGMNPIYPLILVAILPNKCADAAAGRVRARPGRTAPPGRRDPGPSRRGPGLSVRRGPFD